MHVDPSYHASHFFPPRAAGTAPAHPNQRRAPSPHRKLTGPRGEARSRGGNRMPDAGTAAPVHDAGLPGPYGSAPPRRPATSGQRPPAARPAPARGTRSSFGGPRRRRATKHAIRHARDRGNERPLHHEQRRRRGAAQRRRDQRSSRRAADAATRTPRGRAAGTRPTPLVGPESDPENAAHKTGIDCALPFCGPGIGAEKWPHHLATGRCHPPGSAPGHRPRPAPPGSPVTPPTRVKAATTR